jgi:glycosyltransferase involved in cell wall biosynthesis
LILFTEYYEPAQKAGGPITSIRNLYQVLKAHMPIHIITSAYDLNGTVPLPNIALNTFSKDRYYTLKDLKSCIRLGQWIKKHQDELFYINGLYTWHLSLLPALLGKRLVIAPRGMLQTGAMLKNKWVKILYLLFYRVVLLNKKVHWHATDLQEQQDILKYFGKYQHVKTIPNIINSPLNSIQFILKKKENLKLISLSLITEKKNTLKLIQLLQATQLPIELDLYGPIKDAAYWERCQQLIEQSSAPCQIKYKGSVAPSEIAAILQQYHASVLLSKGENFGHAIYESLAVGRPVILSDKTPWTFITPAGATFSDADDAKLIAHLHSLYNEEQQAWNMRAQAALAYAQDYAAQQDLETAYLHLFNNR